MRVTKDEYRNTLKALGATRYRDAITMLDVCERTALVYWTSGISPRCQRGIRRRWAILTKRAARLSKAVTITPDTLDVKSSAGQ